MSFKLKVTKEDVAKGGGGGASFIGTSGVYDATILAVTYDENDNGAPTLGFYVDLGNDNTQMLYGALPMANYDNTQVLEGNQKTFGGLCTLADVDLATDFEPVEASLPIGKQGAAKDVNILEEFEDVPVRLWVKQEYYRKGDKSIGENRILRGVFRQEDNASADELIAAENGDEVEFGSRFARLEKYFKDIKYADVTPEEVQAMIDARSGKDTKADKPAGKTTERKGRFAK